MDSANLPDTVEPARVVENFSLAAGEGRAATAAIADLRAKSAPSKAPVKDAELAAENQAILAEGDAARGQYQEQVTQLAAGGELGAKFFESAPWVDLYQRTEARLALTVERLEARSPASGIDVSALERQEEALLGQLESIDRVILAQKREQHAGRTGYLFVLRDRSVELVKSSIGALAPSARSALAPVESALAPPAKSALAPSAPPAKSALAPSARSALAPSGESALAPLGSQRKLSALYAVVAKELRALRAEQARVNALIKELERVPVLSTADEFLLKEARLIRAGAALDSADKPVSLARQIRALEGAATALLEAQKFIELRTAPPPKATPLEAVSVDAASLFVRAAQNDVHRRAGQEITRDYLQLLVNDEEATAQLLASTGIEGGAAILAAPEVARFARALLANPLLQQQLSADRDGDYDLREIKKYAEQWQSISQYRARLPKIRSANITAAEKVPEPAYFRGALAKVSALDPTSAPWGFSSSRFFAHISDLDAPQRAFALGLFDAQFSEKRGDQYLSELFKHMQPGEGVAYARILTGTTTQEESNNFAKYWLTQDRGLERFVEHHQVGLKFLEKADARTGVELPAALLGDYRARVADISRLTAERQTLSSATELASVDRRIRRLAGELEVLSSALTDASNAEKEDYARALAETRTFLKQLGVAAAATAAAYFTAGALAPAAGSAWGTLAAAGIATTAGTAAGVGAAVVFDLAEQAGGGGEISLKQAGKAGLDAAPGALLSALPAGVLTAAMAARTATIYKGLEVARAAGTLRVGMELKAKAQLAGELAVYATASNYVGNIAAAGFLHAQGRNKEAGLLLENIHRDAVFAGASSALLMPLSRVTGAPKIFSDAGVNVAQAIAYNQIVGRAWDEGLSQAAVSGTLLGRIGARRAAVRTERDVKPVKGPGRIGVVPNSGMISREIRDRLGIDEMSSWTGSRNEQGGMVYRSTTQITQHSPHMEGLVMSAGDQPVTIVSGFHGSFQGEIIPYRDFYDRDALYFSKYKNVEVIDGSKLTPAEREAVMSRKGVVIIASCYSRETYK